MGTTICPEGSRISQLFVSEKLLLMQILGFSQCSVWAADVLGKNGFKRKIDFCDFSRTYSRPIIPISGGFGVLMSTPNPLEMGRIGALYVLEILWFWGNFWPILEQKKVLLSWDSKKVFWNPWLVSGFREVQKIENTWKSSEIGLNPPKLLY